MINENYLLEPSSFALLNSLTLFPIPRINSGSFLPPKINTTTTPIKIISITDISHNFV